MNFILSQGSQGYAWIGDVDQGYGSPVRPGYGSGPYILSFSHVCVCVCHFKEYYVIVNNNNNNTNSNNNNITYTT